MIESDNLQMAETVSPQNGWIRPLGACLGVFGICALYTIMNFYDARRDADIAPREQSAMGVITDKTTGKNGSIYFRFPYSSDHIFSYHDVYYNDSEEGGKGFNVGQKVKVYFDPNNPWTGSLSDFRESSNRHARNGRLLLACAILSGVAGVFCLFRARGRRREIV